MEKLKNTQHWMLSVLASPGNLDESLQFAKSRYGKNIEDMIENKGVSQYIRMGVYAQGYLLRLLECLRADFPSLRNLMGEELFDFFAEAYIRTQPSSSPSLFNLGKDFPSFLEKNQPKEKNEEFTIIWQLAALERARTESMREKEDKNQNQDFDLISLLTVPHDRLKLSSSLRLLKLSYPLIPFIHEVDNGGSPNIPKKEECFIAITRQNYFIKMYTLESWQYEYLKGDKSKIPDTQKLSWMSEALSKGLLIYQNK